MQAVTLSSKFQIVIPKALRQELHYQAGEKFVLIPKGNVLQMVPQLSIKNIEGLLKGADIRHTRDRSDRL